MAWTKGEIVNEAFAELALGGQAIDIDPEERQLGLRRLDAMMASWESRGILLSYNFTTDLDGASGLADGAVEGVWLKLAESIGPTFGKSLPASARVRCKAAYDALLVASVKPAMQQLPAMPIGAGNKPRSIAGGPFMAGPDLSSLAADNPVV